jgi:hypothetical protein
MTRLHDKLDDIRATTSLLLLDLELSALSQQIDTETNPIRRNYLCAAYQALRWARNPDGYAPPSEHREIPALCLIQPVVKPHLSS